MLQRYFAAETVEKTCDHCKAENVAHRIEHKIRRLPQVLVLHIKRFKMEFMPRGNEMDVKCIKLQNRISIPTVLRLRQFCTPTARGTSHAMLKKKGIQSGTGGVCTNDENTDRLNDDTAPARPHHADDGSGNQCSEKGMAAGAMNYIADAAPASIHDTPFFRPDDATPRPATTAAASTTAASMNDPCRADTIEEQELATAMKNSLEEYMRSHEKAKKEQEVYEDGPAIAEAPPHWTQGMPVIVEDDDDDHDDGYGGGGNKNGGKDGPVPVQEEEEDGKEDFTIKAQHAIKKPRLDARQPLAPWSKNGRSNDDENATGAANMMLTSGIKDLVC